MATMTLLKQTIYDLSGFGQSQAFTIDSKRSKVASQISFVGIGVDHFVGFVLSAEDLHSLHCVVNILDAHSGADMVPRHKVRRRFFFLSNFGISGRKIPQLLYSENINPSLLIMRKEYAWHIAGALQQEEAQAWALLYHNSVHGLSFNTFMGNLAVGRGPSILLIKDKEGYIYGGYASQPWERHNNFYGDMKSFLFSLSPRAALYRPTGANSNMQWCAMNFMSTSVPNGLGFGGQVNHFGLFLSESFELGHSFESVTYKSPCLSKTATIFPEIIECWGVVVKGDEQETLDAVKGTVLERFKEDHNLLKMVGIANSSDQ